MTGVPLSGLSDPAVPVAWRAGAPVTAGELLGDAGWLAGRLPARGYQINLCGNRYHFLTALLAALMRGQVLLLPPGRARGDLDALRHGHPSSYCLSDSAADCGDLEPLQFTGSPGGLSGRTEDLNIAGDPLVAELFTSSSTGTATRHGKRWAALCRGAASTGARLGLDRLEGASVVASVPPQHMYGLEMSVFLPLYWGLMISEQRPLFAADIAAALAAVPQPRILVTTPFQLRNCIMENLELPAPEFILSSTAPLTRDLAQVAERRYRTRVLEIYGSTETGAVASRRTARETSWSPLSGLSVERRGQRWWIRADHFPEAVALNDDIRLQADGRFDLLGRDTDLIKIAGKRVSLADLNQKLLSIEGVEDGIFFLPESAGGAIDRLTCFVVAPGLAEDEILTAMRRMLDPVFLPRPLFRVASLPRNETGKLPRKALLRLFEVCGGEQAPGP